MEYTEQEKKEMLESLKALPFEEQAKKELLRKKFWIFYIGDAFPEYNKIVKAARKKVAFNQNIERYVRSLKSHWGVDVLNYKTGYWQFLGTKQEDGKSLRKYTCKMPEDGVGLFYKNCEALIFSNEIRLKFGTFDPTGGAYDINTYACNLIQYIEKAFTGKETDVNLIYAKYKSKFEDPIHPSSIDINYHPFKCNILLFEDCFMFNVFFSKDNLDIIE